MTGISVTKANRTSSTIEVHENASFELVIVLSVLPAWIARNDGGATPTINTRKSRIENNIVNSVKFYSLTEKCANGKREQWHTDDGRHQIDEPVGQERRHSQEQHVAEQFILVLLHLQRPLVGAFREKVPDDASTDQLGQQIAHRCADGRAQTHQTEGDGKAEQETAQYGEEQ